GAMKLPFSPSVFFRDITAMGGVDLQGLEGWHYLAPGIAQPGFPIDGRMDAQERAFDGHGSWFALVGNGEGILVAVTMSGNRRKGSGAWRVYMDEAGGGARREFGPGGVPLVGMEGHDGQRLAAGRYPFQPRILGLPGYTPGDEDRELRRLDAPLTADVTL